ncbi:MAG: GTP-binding protein, partial [Candidatus Binatia bacterium]
MGKVKEITEGGNAVNSEFHCGTVALAGRANVGKSTLLNRLVGARVAIETAKPQATRSRVLGIRTLPSAQILWVDLPGIHRARSAMNRRMVDTARRSIEEADVVLAVIDAGAGLVRDDAEVTRLAAAQGAHWLFALNKIDLLGKGALVRRLAEIHDRFPDRDVVPV